MKFQFLAFIISFSLAFSPLVSYASPSMTKNPSQSACDQILYVEQLKDLPPELIEATHDYVKKQKVLKSNQLLTHLRKSLSWLNPLTVVRYFRGETTPDDSLFRIYSKKMIVNGEELDQVIYVVGLPKLMRQKDRQRLDELASHFQRFGIPYQDHKIDRKFFSRRFFLDEFGFAKGMGLWTLDKTVKLWDFSTRKLPLWLFIHSLPLPIPMPARWRPFAPPLFDDLKNLKIRVTGEDGNVSYEKIKMDPKEEQLFYLLNKHRPNAVEAMDKLGGDARALLVLTFIYSAISDILRTLDSGINQVSDYGTILPVVALVFSRLVAATLNALQDGTIPKMNAKNLYILARDIRTITKDLTFQLLQKEVEKPSQSVEEVFETYKWNIGNDDYWQKAFTALFGHEPKKRDGAVIYTTNTIGDNLRVMTDSGNVAERQLKNALQNYLSFQNQIGPDNEVIGDGILNIQLSDPNNPLSPKITKTIAVNLDQTPIIEDSALKLDPKKPLLVLVEQDKVNGVNHQMIKLGFLNAYAVPMDEEELPKAQ
ncbi:MAG: hypothetical protein H6625_05890 [Bdellovibrionaceae bacterium]|nr:hypothetical protein [Pseudobdellovibrionaceae bacterium]